MKKTILKIEASILASIIICCVFNITAFSGQCDSIRNKMLRMHVIANSDTLEDQQLKLKVRDALLKTNASILSDDVTKENAKEHFENSKEILLITAKETLKENGFNYNVKITLKK